MAQADLAVTASFNISPPVYGSLTGTVTDENLSAIPDIVISILKTNLSSTTNTDEFYLIKNIPIGEYNVSARLGPNGYLYLSTNNRDSRGVPDAEDDKIIIFNPSLIFN